MPSGYLNSSIGIYGKEDDYLTANPEITFFKSIYHKRVHYGVEWNELTFTQQPAWGKSTSLIIPRNYGDLIHEIIVEFTLPALSNAYCYGVGNAIIKSVAIEIGGVIIDTHTADWLNIAGELTTEEGQLRGYDAMVHNYNNLAGLPEIVRYVPLRFWFNRNISAALPIGGLTYQDVKLIFEFETAEVISQTVLPSATTELKCRIFAKFIHLDEVERRIMVARPTEYLIEQIQYNEFKEEYNIPSYKAKLTMFSPVKELIWFHRKTSYDTDYGIFDYTCDDAELHTFTSGRLMLNNSARFDERFAQYFYLQNGSETASSSYRTPRTDIVHKAYDTSFIVQSDYYRNYIYMYSFARGGDGNGSAGQPSGHCNFSRFNSIILELKYDAGVYKYERILGIFAVNYNMLKFNGNGSCGLMYSH